MPLERGADRADAPLGALGERARRGARGVDHRGRRFLRAFDRVVCPMLGVEHASDRRFHSIVGCACGGHVFGGMAYGFH